MDNNTYEIKINDVVNNRNPMTEEDGKKIYGNHGRKPLSTISRQGMNSVYEKY